MNKLLRSKRFWIVIILVICVVCTLANRNTTSGGNESVQEVSETSEPTRATGSSDTSKESDEQVDTETAIIEYDELQTVFLAISDAFTENDLLEMVSENNLYINDDESDDVHYYKIAYAEDVTKFSHAEEGDNIEISFYADGSVRRASYFNKDLFVSALYNDSSSGYEYAYTDYSYSANLREDGSKSGTAHMNYYEAESIEDALLSALSIQ